MPEPSDHVGVVADRPDAVPPVPGDPPDDETVEYLLFRCGPARCAAPHDAFAEVLRALPPVAALPSSPPWLHGVFALRGELVGLVDPSLVLLADPAGAAGGAAAASAPPAGALVAGEPGALLGLTVAEVGPTVVLRAGEVAWGAPAPGAPGSVAPAYAAGHCSSLALAHPCAIVDVRRLVADLVAALAEGAARDAAAE